MNPDWASPSPSSRTETLLLVDDKAENLHILGTLLQTMGYRILQATNGEEAFRRLDEEVPDLVLLDLIMPEMDGFEVCERIRENPAWRDLPIIFVSAADDPNIIVQALEAGGIDYVTKPYNKAELLSRVRTHLALASTRADLRTLAEDKDELLGILAHDLKNHLAGMQMSAALLVDQAASLPPSASQLIENIDESTRRMLAFVREFLANQAAGQMAPHLGPLPLNQHVQASLTRNLPLAEAKHIALSFHAEPGVGLAYADPDALGQVLDNLISNAIKFSQPGTAVVVAVRLDAPGWVGISVADQGPGFTPEDRERLFRRYGRLSARPTASEPSTGLGLSIVKRLVDAMQGRVSLREEQPEGAEFVVQLRPVEAIRQAPAGSAASKASTLSPHGYSSRR